MRAYVLVVAILALLACQAYSQVGDCSADNSELFPCVDGNEVSSYDICVQGVCQGQQSNLVDRSIDGNDNNYYNTSRWLLLDSALGQDDFGAEQANDLLFALLTVAVDSRTFGQFRFCFEYGAGANSLCQFQLVVGSTMDVNGIRDNRDGIRIFVQIMMLPDADPETGVPANCPSCRSPAALSQQVVGVIANGTNSFFNSINVFFADERSCARFDGKLQDLCPVAPLRENLGRNLGIKVGGAFGAFLITLMVCVLYYYCKAKGSGEKYGRGSTTESTASMESSSASSSAM